MLTISPQRRLLSPGFSISYLNALEPIVKECVKVFEEWLDNECAKGNGYTVIDISNMMGNLSFVSLKIFKGTFTSLIELIGYNVRHILRWLLQPRCFKRQEAQESLP